MAAVAFTEQAGFTNDPSCLISDVLEGAEVVVDAHPASPYEVVVVVLALHLVHLLLVVLEDEEERANPYLLQLLQLREDPPLVHHLHPHHSEQVSNVQVAESSFIDPQQVHDQILALESFYP